MIKLLKNKKFIIALLVVFLLTGGVFILGAHQAHAGLWDILTKPGQAVTLLFAWLMEIILTFFSKFLGLAMSLLEAIFKIGRFSKVPVVQAGWQITRGLANMFFALILLIMAVSTVLGMESFGARRILVRLIIAALLINFSLLFGGVIIDFSQVLTDYFIIAAGGTATGTAGQSSISTQLANGLNIARVFADPNQFETLMAGGDASRLVNMGVGMLFGIIIIAVATFVVLAAALFLIIRVAILWLLLIFAPLAWVSMVVPGGMAGSIWGMWWKSFFQWAFFAPIYAFFLYLAVMAISSNSLAQAFVNAQINAAQSGFLTGFLNGTISLVLQYIVILIILCGGLLVAQKFGIYGASAVISAGKRAGKGVAKWSGRQAARPAQYGYEKASAAATAAAGKALSKIPGFSKVGGRLQAKATQMKEKPEERKQHKAYANLIKKMSDVDLANETKSAWGVRKLIAAREAKERGVLAKTENKEVVQQAMKTFSTYGAKTLNAQGKDDGKTKEQRELEETRFDVIENETEQKEAIRRSKESGNLDKINAVVLKDKAVMKAVMDELTPPEYNETYKKWGKNTKKAANSAMADNLDPNSNFAQNAPDMKYRKLYATSTGNLTKAFGTAAEEMKGAADQAAGEFIKAMKPSQIGDIFEEAVDEAGKNYGKESLKLVGRHIDKSMLASTTGELNATQKAIITLGIEENKSRQDIKEYMEKSPAWGGRIPTAGAAEKEAPKEAPKIEVASSYTRVPPPGERKR